MILKICVKIVPKVSSENDECIEVALSRSWTPDRTNYDFFSVKHDAGYCESSLLRVPYLIFHTSIPKWSTSKVAFYPPKLD